MGEIVQLKKTRMPRSRDAFYQAIPVNEIQGQFFYFGRNKLSPAELFAREKAKAEELYGGLPEDRNFEIIHNAYHGMPGALAYRIWTGIEKFMSDAGSNFDGRLKLSTRQIAKMAGRAYSGQAAKEIVQAIKQLDTSEITYWYEHPELKNEDGSPEIHQENFSLIDKVSIVRDQQRSAPHYYIITIPEIILGFLFHDRYFFCMSWDRVKTLSPQSQSVARILYRYMSYRYSKANTEKFFYRKNYATMCKEWFGDITPYEKMSEITRTHLAPRFDPIVASGLLASYSVEANKAGNGFNVNFVPGKEFFADFESFYRKQMPLDFGEFKSARDPHLGNPKTNIEDGAFALLGHFHEKWFGDKAERDYLSKEIELAQSILKDAPLEDAMKFVDWAIIKAQETNFKMQTFNALGQYHALWKTERKHESDRLQKVAAIRSREEEATNKKLYEDFIQSEAQSILDTMSEDERTALQADAKKQLQLQLPDTKKFLSGHLLSVERRLIVESHDFPDFDTWKSSR